MIAETDALKQAAILVQDSLEPCSPTVLFTEALSVLEALHTNKSPLLATQMQELGNTCRVVLQWIPAHCGIPGNEQADQQAKYGAQEEQPSTSIRYQEKTSIIKTALKRKMHTTFLTGPVRWFWHDCVPVTTGSTHTCTGTKNRSFPQRVPVVRRTRQPNMFFRDVTDTNNSESHSGHQQLRFTRNYMGAWMT